MIARILGPELALHRNAS